MSEEILKALMQLFAIIAKQDGGVESNEIEYVKNFLTQQLNDEAVQEYYELFEQHADLKADDSKKQKLTSVKDSVRILGICKKINKTLTQRQKIVVLVRLFELVNADNKFTDQRMAIINTVAEVFKLSRDEFAEIEAFVINNNLEDLDNPSLLIIGDSLEGIKEAKKITSETLDGNIIILQIKSVDLYFLRYTGNEDVFLNGLPINNRRIYLFASGSSVKLPRDKPIYYSDVVSHFLADSSFTKISFEVKNLNFKFPTGAVGIRNANLSENHGKLIGIMGASGAGKTTMLNVLCGLEKPTSGEVLINGINLHEEKDKLEGVIGYIPQDDLLIEELTVFENLYYNAKFCFDDKSEEEITEMVDKTLTSLDLYQAKELKVGSPLKKTISGGQRKRLNIALELIREPSILFVDEPTSGLSSRDSENVMDLLRELTLKGKLIFCVIHQPSSDIYKMFDNVAILDTGGYVIYYGNPVESVMYFKRMDQQINSDVGECPVCGNVNPELIFNIIDKKVVDEFGRYTNTRKVTPKGWEERYSENISLPTIEHQHDEPPKNLNIPNWLKQFKIYSIRDMLSKISNKQYIILNLLEAPLLGFILSYIIRYIEDPTSNVYIFRENENIPIYIFMSIIVALFLGLIVSAEEIFKDRKILKREAFLNLSRSSYLSSKILILFLISAIQAFLFVMVGNTILGIKEQNFYYWLMLFSTSAFANMLGLNISASFNSNVTIYILIPLLMIPQMILGGAMFSFDKLNRDISKVGKVPFLAEFMVTKWAYEGLMVRQFKDNEFEKYFYDTEKKISFADFKQVYHLPELNDKLDDVIDDFANDNIDQETESNLKLLKNELAKEMDYAGQLDFQLIHQLDIDSFTTAIGLSAKEYLTKLDKHYGNLFQQAYGQKENIISYWLSTNPELYRNKRDTYHNERVAEIVKKTLEKNKILEYDNKLYQNVDPIYLDPSVEHLLSFRSHFFAPRKHFMGAFFDTFWFNVVIVWLLSLIMYITLYYEHLKKLLNLPEKFKSLK